MATDFSIALADEIADLERRLDADPRYAKLRELRRVQALYEVPEEPEIGNAADATTRVRVTTNAGRSPSPERQAILDSARLVLNGRLAPTPTYEIYQELVELGIQVPGNSPKNNLSAMLSNAKAMFKSHGRTGWTLIEQSPEAPSDLLGRSTPEASMSSPASPAGEPSDVRPVDPVPGGGG